MSKNISTMIFQKKKTIKDNLVVSSFLLHHHQAALNAQGGDSQARCRVVLVSWPTGHQLWNPRKQWSSVWTGYEISLLAWRSDYFFICICFWNSYFSLRLLTALFFCTCVLKRKMSHFKEIKLSPECHWVSTKLSHLVYPI